MPTLSSLGPPVQVVCVDADETVPAAGLAAQAGETRRLETARAKRILPTARSTLFIVFSSFFRRSRSSGPGQCTSDAWQRRETIRNLFRMVPQATRRGEPGTEGETPRGEGEFPSGMGEGKPSGGRARYRVQMG